MILRTHMGICCNITLIENSPETHENKRNKGSVLLLLFAILYVRAIT